MKFQCKFVNVLEIFLLVFAVVGIGFDGMGEAVSNGNSDVYSYSCFPSHETIMQPSELAISQLMDDTSNPLGYLFHLMFILFFISPPIIAFLLFLIWKELKEKNRMK